MKTALKNTLGIYEKFVVTRTDKSDHPGEKHHGCRYFVIDLDHDEFAPVALKAYADACAHKYPRLAIDLAASASELTHDEGAAGYARRIRANEVKAREATRNG